MVTIKQEYTIDINVVAHTECVYIEQIDGIVKDVVQVEKSVIPNLIAELQKWTPKKADETASLRSEIAQLRSRLSDCERKRLTGERI